MSEIEQMQERYCARVSKHDRRTAGQFFTPRWIARGLARWVLAADPETIVDPAFGLGMLLDECSNQGYAGGLTGYEVDPAIVATWHSEANGSMPVELVEADFLRSDPGMLQAVVANPPYNRFQNRDVSPYIRQKMREVLGETPSGYTNQYALFLYAVLARLATNGRAAFIVPSEFLGTGYGAQIKKFLVRSRRLRHLVLFDTSARIFPDAATTACVLLFGEGSSDTLSVWHLQDQVDEERFLSICGETAQSGGAPAILCYSALSIEANWQGLGTSAEGMEGLVGLKTFGRATRGIATGANEFFVLTEPDAARLGLSQAELMPCIASAASVEGVVFTESDLESLRRSGKRIYLFDGVNAGTQAAADYVSGGEREGYHLRYLTKTRRPWYRLEARGVAPLLLAVFGRSGFKAVLNQSVAVNLTAFHGFYPNPRCADLVPLIWLYLQTPLAHRASERQQRRYGDGLKKLEPGDWGKLLVPNWLAWDTDALGEARAVTKRSIQSLVQHDESGWTNCIDNLQNLVDRQRARHLHDCEPATPREQLPLFLRENAPGRQMSPTMAVLHNS